MNRRANPPDTRTAAEKTFRAVTTKKGELPLEQPAIPGVKEHVTLRVDCDVLDYFQADAPAWQQRINQALRKAGE